MRITLLERFNRLRKFLAIVLDGEILQRVLADPMASNLPVLTGGDLLHRASTTQDSPGRPSEPQTTASSDAQDPVKRLCDVLYHQDDYFDRKLYSVELLIDIAIAARCASSEVGATDDFFILLMKLDGL